MKVNVKTEFNEFEIRQRLEFEDEFGLEMPSHDSFPKDIIRLKDEGVRRALIELGWTPPSD